MLFLRKNVNMSYSKKNIKIGIFGDSIPDNYGLMASYYSLYIFLKECGYDVMIIPPLGHKNWCKRGYIFFKEVGCEVLKKKPFEDLTI